MKWFEILIVIAVIATSTIFSVQKSQNLKSKQIILSKKEEIISDFYQKSPIGEPISKDAFETAIQAYSPELAAIERNARYTGDNGKLTEEAEISTRIGVLQGQINDIKEDIKAMKEASIPWWLNLILGVGSWFLAHLFSPIATAFGEKLRDSFIEKKSN